MLTAGPARCASSLNNFRLSAAATPAETLSATRKSETFMVGQATQ
jgi:hypothetical protein